MPSRPFPCLVIMSVLLASLLDLRTGSGQALTEAPGPPGPDQPCIIDDPWVWEDFGGPIPCEGPVDPTACSSASAAAQAGCGQSEEAFSQAIVTWEQIKQAQGTTGDPTVPSPHDDLNDLLEDVSGSVTSGSSPLSQGSCTLGSGATGPGLGLSFPAATRTDANGSVPPDTMGAVGPSHFLQVINGFVGVFDKTSGHRIDETSLNNFFSSLPSAPGTVQDVFDPRVVFDQHSGRWIVSAVKGKAAGNLVGLAVSLTADPTGAWFQASYKSKTILNFADYPTLGVDARGIYVATDNVAFGTPRDELWAILKAPLIAQPPYAGFFRHWRSQPTVPWSPLISVEGALQPAHSYGDSGSQYLIQTRGSDSLEIYRITWPLITMNCATLTLLGTVAVDSFLPPQDAPAKDGDPIDTLDGRLLMAVFRDGFLWTCHAVALTSGGPSLCRWYKIEIDAGTDPPTLSLAQCGAVDGGSLHYYFPSMMVNSGGDVVMGFSGSNAAQYVAAYFTGRLASQPTLDMAVPTLLKDGENAYTVLMGGGNRWGDYSYTTLDPLDQTTFWTIQEYAETPANTWGTRVGQVSFSAFDCDNDGTSDAAELIVCGPSCDCNANGKPDSCEPDCNANGHADGCDITGGTSQDCNQNGIPDSCDLTGGTSLDCNGNGTPFECEAADCNRNCTSDAQDIAGGTSQDCNANGTPDSCEGADCNANQRLDACDISGGTSLDCDKNRVPDECQADCDGDDTPDECEKDCNSNGFPDMCDIASGTALDCNANGTPDECEAVSYCLGTYTPCAGDDCNFNGVRDPQDIASGISQDANANGTPDECDSPALPLVCADRVVSWKDHANHSNPEEEYIEINRAGRIQFGTVTSESRWRDSNNNEGAITELRITLSGAVPWPVSNPVTVFEQTRESCVAACPGGRQAGYRAYTGNSSVTPTLQGTTLTLSFSPGLENTRTYRIRINTTLTRIAQAFELRCLKADATSNGRVDSGDRSAVIGIWTGPGYSTATDINLDGVTNGGDRSQVVAAWTGLENCGP